MVVTLIPQAAQHWLTSIITLIGGIQRSERQREQRQAQTTLSSVTAASAHILELACSARFDDHETRIGLQQELADTTADMQSEADDERLSDAWDSLNDAMVSFEHECFEGGSDNAVLKQVRKDVTAAWAIFRCPDPESADAIGSRSVRLGYLVERLQDLADEARLMVRLTLIYRFTALKLCPNGVTNRELRRRIEQADLVSRPTTGSTSTPPVA